MRSVAAATLVVVLLLAPGVMGWPGLGGDARRTGVAALPQGPLDVLTPGTRVVGEGHVLNIDTPGVVWTPTGLYGAVADFEGEEILCALFHVPDPRASLIAEVVKELECYNGRLVAGYDEASHTIIVTSRAPEDRDLLVGISLDDFDERWRIRATPHLGVTRTNAIVVGNWESISPALDVEKRVGTAVARQVGAHGNRIFQFSLDTGEVLWHREIPVAIFASAPGAALDTPGFYPYAPTVLPDGIVVAGRVGEEVGSYASLIVKRQAGLDSPATPDPQRGAVAWLTSTGEPVGGAILRPSAARNLEGEAASVELLGSSEMATGVGAVAAAALGNELLVINPRTPQVAAHMRLPDTVVESGKAVVWPAPRAWQRSVVVPLTESVSLFDSAGGESLWTHREPSGWRVADTMVAADGRLFVLAYNVAASPQAALVELDLATGRESHRLPLAINVTLGRSGLSFIPDRGWFVRMVPADDGIVIVDLYGNGIFLGEAEGGAAVSIDNAYPLPGDETIIQVAPDTGAAVVTVSWGDGTSEILEGETARHSYAESGRYRLRVVTQYADGRTATTEQAVHVGGEAPRTLTPLQRAFSAEQQEMTFFALGLLVTLVGAGVGIARLRRRDGLLKRELAALETIAASDGEAAEGLLAERKARARMLLADRRLEAGQLAVIEKRIDEIHAQLRLRVLDEELAFVSVGMARTLRAMIADGRIARWEREHLVDALDRDAHLTEDQKARVRAKIEAWASRDAARG